MSAVDAEYARYYEMIDSLVNELQEYSSHDPEFNLAAIRMLTPYGSSAGSNEHAIQVLFTILLDLQHTYAHNEALQAILAIGGVSGLGILVREVLSNRQGGFDLYTGPSMRPAADYLAWQRTVLTALANHPVIVSLVLIPALVSSVTDAAVPDHIKRAIFCAIPLFGDESAAEYSDTIALCLETENVMRKEVMLALRAQGDAAERILIALALDSSNPPIQKLAILGLGAPPLGLSSKTKAVDIELKQNPIPGPSVVVGFREPEEGQEQAVLELHESTLLCLLKTALEKRTFPPDAFEVERDVPLADDDDDLETRMARLIAQQAKKSPDNMERFDRDRSALDFQYSDGSPSIAAGSPHASEEQGADDDTGPLLMAKTVSPAAVDCLTTLLTQRRVSADVLMAVCASCGAIGMPEGAAFAAPLEALLGPKVRMADPGLRAAVTQTLANFAPLVTERGILQLIKQLDDSSWAVRYQSALALAAVGSRADRAVTKLRGLLERSRSNRADIAACLANMGEAGEVTLLELLNHSRPDLRSIAARGLAHMNVYRPTLERISMLLAEALGKEGQATVRCALLDSLNTLSSRSFEQVTFLQTQTLVEILRKHLNDRVPDVRKHAAHLLAHNGVIGQSALRHALNQARSSAVIIACIGGLAESGARCLFALLLVFQNNQDQGVQGAVVRALVHFGADRILDHLYKLDHSSRQNNIRTLRQVQASPFPSVSSDRFQSLLADVFEALEEDGLDVR
ncbi:PBS lyase HEAT-like repeat family protein [Carpediemonas membranifera]|uniref:PBS lyase HEAT-like repeat family protein n=1 Tax=Carpediemonas membranifera TaxID=201153 RepID=A0A8J6E6E8_9EUKA|nr:PBS lyase HEAT-like repeat family protein [Carpediemonas membranifera]|eukprot:KAG9397027.1 PBS lyase HEAT-like repeat family protein [Carpediemonas membranifera]